MVILFFVCRRFRVLLLFSYDFSQLPSPPVCVCVFVLLIFVNCSGFFCWFSAPLYLFLGFSPCCWSCFFVVLRSLSSPLCFALPPCLRLIFLCFSSSCVVLPPTSPPFSEFYKARERGSFLV
ncbi:hypothetical protein BDE02_01G378900 [Populus trichocarpa]|nr:hypothetical protein BDE02_01G378900 [Populus trichocarpa]